MTTNYEFQSTPPLRGATCMEACMYGSMIISIHAPLAGSDVCVCVNDTQHTVFQSTPPLRGATGSVSQRSRVCSHFNPRPPCGERRRPSSRSTRSRRYFNPRPPCGERRLPSLLCFSASSFQSTPPLRGATSGGITMLVIDEFQSTPPLRGATSHRFHLSR